MSTPNKDWAALLPPSLVEIERIADVSFADLPETFRNLCEGLVIQVEDFPADEILDEMDCETEFDLLGLFRGNGLAQAAAVPQDGPDAEYDLALSAADSRLLGGKRRGARRRHHPCSGA